MFSFVKLLRKNWLRRPKVTSWRWARAPRLECLEDRTLLSVSVTASGVQQNVAAKLTFNDPAKGDVYVAVAPSGEVSYSGTGISALQDSGYKINGSSTITLTSQGTLHLEGMGSSTGTTPLGGTFNALGTVEIAGSMYTQGGNLTIMAGSIAVDNASQVSGATGTLTDAVHSYQITSVNSTTQTITAQLQGSGSPNLQEGELITYAGSDPGLMNGQQYAVHVISQSSSSDTVQLQLFQPVVVSTSSTTSQAGSLSMMAPTITVGSYDRLLAQGPGQSAATNGSITLQAVDTITDSAFFLANLNNDVQNQVQNANVTLGTDSYIAGGNVSVTAEAGNKADLGIFGSEASAFFMALRVFEWVTLGPSSR